MKALEGKPAKAGAGGERGAVADLLNSDHQGPGQKRGPQKGEAELGPGL